MITARNPPVSSARGRPSRRSLGYLSLLTALGMAAALALYYLYLIWPLVTLPADILMWAETGFVGEIIKLRTGTPIYTAPADSNGNIYTPAAPILTYAISLLIGQPTSIVVWRLIQLGYVVGAALLATVSSLSLYRLLYPKRALPFARTWLVFSFLALFVVATAPRSNAFVHSLHADALALLVSVAAFWSMLFYLTSPTPRRLLLMALWPALGYFVKPFLLSWAAVMVVFLILSQPLRWRHLLGFTLAAGLSTALVIGACYWLWGDAFIFWVFTIMRGHSALTLDVSSTNLSLVRSVEHTLRIWPEIAIGIAGGWLALRGPNLRRFAPLWVSWLTLVAAEAFTSGAGWSVLYHFGPGILIGGAWLLAALPAYWPLARPAQGEAAGRSSGRSSGLEAFGMVAAVLVFFSVLHAVPSGDLSEPRYWGRHVQVADVYRYIGDIEQEFASLPPSAVLLDSGNWIYLRSNYLARDRSVSLGDQAPGGIYENLDVMVGRIRSQVYSKVLVRDFHSPMFLYDWATWQRPSGVRQALLDYYTEVRVIPAVKGDAYVQQQVMLSGPISVLVPKSGVAVGVH